ncbi:MAG: hypothetical protein PHH51_01940 [Bacilli bacterium]|nr:hypothetical protein [Bacilli bacterium]MDD3895848.1 hypothetical protein [Bacilli bacterium]MDD4407964.1 hypothetical protein [Bacilli bacterium]
MKYLKYSLLLILIVFSFYFTEKIMIYMENKNPIMQEISKKEMLYRTESVNAIIKDNTIVPGIDGKIVDKRKSLLKMEGFGSFNETFLIYKYEKPKISLENNKDKIIIKGNPSKRMVSFILEDHSNVTDYFIENKIKYNIIANLKTDLSLNREYLNGEIVKEKASDLNSLLNKNKVNSRLCIINYSNIEYCIEKKHYIIDPMIKTSSNINLILNGIHSGSMILINKNTSIENIKLILSEIRKQDLNIVYVSELISEIN